VGVVTEEDAAVQCDVFERFLRYRALDGLPPPGEHVRRVFAAAAIEAPLTALHCPRLLRFTRLQPTEFAQVSGNVRDFNAAHEARWVTVEQAGEALGLKADSVRKLLRQRKLTGRKDERGWRVDSRSVQRYSPRRQSAA
jgi:hypothetical protein